KSQKQRRHAGNQPTLGAVGFQVRVFFFFLHLISRVPAPFAPLYRALCLSVTSLSKIPVYPSLNDKMAESKTKFEAVREWVVEHKLRTVGCLWASSIAGSIAYEWSRPNKFSVKVIHARLNAQALTLAALAGAAVVEWYDHKAKQTADHAD
ncbi:Hypoxia-responsive family protein, partial [Quillaja saponaria]